MRLMKLALLIELELGCVWMLTLLSAAPGDAVGWAGLMLFVWMYPVHLACMIVGGITFWRFSFDGRDPAKVGPMLEKLDQSLAEAGRTRTDPGHDR